LIKSPLKQSFVKNDFRTAMLTGGSVYGGAWVITGLGVAMHNLPLVYLGNRESAFLMIKLEILP
jgi:hypothetical protein